MSKRSNFWRIGAFLSFFSPLVLASQLAIVIDDIGYRNHEDSAIYTLPKEVAVSIIPSAPYATNRAKQAFNQHRDVMIHLPMQPKDQRVMIEAGALMVGMPQEKISHLIQSARQQVPYAIGLNNHMGSGATSDKTTMQRLMQALSTERLFFLDSKTIGSSVAAQTAREFGIKTLERHIFLDDSDELAAVQKQFQAAVNYARKHGTAIMIGHPRKNSISVLESGIAHLPADIQLTPISSLWRGEQVQTLQPFTMLFGFPPAPSSSTPFNVTPLLRGVPQE